MSQISVLIVDDNFVVRKGLHNFLETLEDVTVLGEVSTGRAATSWLTDNTVDVVLMDIRMPDTDGITATEKITRLNPQTKVLMLSVVADQATLLRALLAGAKGYLVYGQFTPEELLDAIRAVVHGHVVTQPRVAPALLDNLESCLDNIHDIADMENMEPLTERERDILGLIALGKNNREIAAALNIAEKTVKNHINNIYSKLQIRSRYQAISYILRHPQ